MSEVIPLGNDASFEDVIEAVNALRVQQEQIAEMLAQIVDQITPTLDAIKSSPVGKLLGV